MHSKVVLDSQKLQGSIDGFKQRLADQHEAAIQAEEHLKTLVGTSVQIDPKAELVAA